MARETELIPLEGYQSFSEEVMQERSRAFYRDISRRRTVRDFSPKPVSRQVIENCLLAAGTAPNGANLQPWSFVVVHDPEIKRQIRLAAEQEEKAFYQERAPQEWLDALKPLGTDWRKPFLETAPWLIAIFEQKHGVRQDGSKIKHYYSKESVGIATGILITAIHNAGLVSLTHTPSPMGFLNRILHRPDYEKPFLLLVVGHPAENVQVPRLTKKSLLEIATFI